MGRRSPDEEEAAEVVPLPGTWRHGANVLEAALDEEPVRRVLTRPVCEHWRSQVDVSARVVSCRDCGVPLDPIDVLGRIANERGWLIGRVHTLAGERDRLRKIVDELRREEHNAKARTRAARKRSLELDDAALLAACEYLTSTFDSGMHAFSYRPWDELSEDQRPVVLRAVGKIVEAYAGALEERWTVAS